MNGWQVPQQLAYLLRRRAWPDGAAEPVFSPNSVLVTNAIRAAAIGASTVNPPIVMLAPAAGRADPEFHDLREQTIRAVLLTWDEDDTGEKVLLGAHRTSGPGSSVGRGLLELEEQLLAAVEEFNNTSGLRLDGGFVGAFDVDYREDLRHASRAYDFTGMLSRAAYYHAPMRLVATPVGSGGQVSLSWALPPNRFDFHAAHTTPTMPARGGIRLRRASGSTAPASATAGTEVTLASAFATSVTDTPGPGTWSYAVFAAYDEMGSGTDERYSEQETGTTRLGVVAV